MAKKDLLEEAQQLGLSVDAKAKVADIRALIDEAKAAAEPASEDDAESVKTKAGIETTKAGKRSPKALKEEAQKEAKQERKATTAEKPKVALKPARSRLERRGKHFRKVAEQLEAGKAYNLEQAVDLAKKTSYVKFDATVELHINLGVDPKQAEGNIRDNLVLPAGTGKTVRIAVLTEDSATAKQAGAMIAGTDELLAELDKGVINFDTLIAEPALMQRLAKYARILGPRGLMPNPKSGTVTTDIDRAVAEAQAGRVEYRVDSTGIVHLGIGKVSFTANQLLDNLQAVLASIKANKPSNVKGNYLKSVHLTTSMGPSIRIDGTSIG